MKTPRAISLIGALAVASVVLAARPSAQQPPPTTAGLPAAQLKVIKTALGKAGAVTINAVMMEFTGTFDDLPARFEAFQKEFDSQGLNKGKMAARPVGIYAVYEDPRGKSSYRLGVGLQVQGKQTVKDPLKTETFTAPRAVRVPHSGSYKQLQNVHDAIAEQAKGGGAPKTLAATSPSFPSIVRLLDNDPRKVPDNRRRAELIVPFGGTK